jgi:hypothetical protein
VPASVDDTDYGRGKMLDQLWTLLGIRNANASPVLWLCSMDTWISGRLVE